MLTAETARRQSRLGDLIEAHGLPEWSALALYLLELSRNDGRGVEEAAPASDWAPWLQTLPRRTGCVLEWTQDEVCVRRGMMRSPVVIAVGTWASSSEAGLQRSVWHVIADLPPVTTQSVDVHNLHALSA